jgi:predicted Zn-dependent protease
MLLLRGFEVLRRSAFLGCLGALVGFVLPLGAQDLTKAEELYKRTEFQRSIDLLDKQSDDSAVTFLIGRDYFMLADFKKASEYLQKASAAQPGNSEYMDWLGRAYGKRAETANPFSAPGYASKARQAFERSVELDGRNKDALSDLFDYYLEAPGFLGGGYEKAQSVARKMAVVDPPEAYFAEAKLAQKKKEYDTAEERLRASVSAAPRQVGHLIELARLLANEGRTRESDEVFVQAQQVGPNLPKVWFARADVLIKQNRNLAEARDLLQKYMRASITVDDPPKNEALRLLKQVGGA